MPDIPKLVLVDPNPEDLEAYLKERVKAFPLDLLFSLFEIAKCLRERDEYGNSTHVSPRLFMFSKAIVDEVARRTEKAKAGAFDPADPASLEWWTR